MRRALAAALLGGLLLAAPAPVAAANSISYCAGGQTGSGCPGTPTITTGVYFTVTTGGDNRDFASIAVRCADGTGTVVYSTVLTVSVAPKGSGISQTIYPPAGSCTADLVKLNQIGSARVLASTSFTIL